MRAPGSKLRVLFLSASPSDTARLAVSEEYRRIETKIRASDGRDRFELTFEHEVRAAEFGEALQRNRPDVVHFSGHGSEDGELLLADTVGNARVVKSSAVVRMFRALSRDARVRCVLLNACYSEELAKALSEHVDCVIGMPTALGDRAAIAFAGGFYEAVGFGRDVDAAFQYACAQTELAVDEGESLPTLWCRAGVRAADVRLLAGTGGAGRAFEHRNLDVVEVERDAASGARYIAQKLLAGPSLVAAAVLAVAGSAAWWQMRGEVEGVVAQPRVESMGSAVRVVPRDVEPAATVDAAVLALASVRDAGAPEAGHHRRRHHDDEEMSAETRPAALPVAPVAPTQPVVHATTRPCDLGDPECNEVRR